MSDNYDSMTEAELRQLMAENAGQMELIRATIAELKRPVTPQAGGNYASVDDVLTAIASPIADNAQAIMRAERLLRQHEGKNGALSVQIQRRVETANRKEVAAFVRKRQPDFEAAAKLLDEYRALCLGKGIPNQLPDISYTVSQVITYAHTLK